MRLSLIAIAAGLSIASAQLGSLPSCAGPCVTKFTSGDQIAGCKSLDIACICSNASFLSSIACCLTSACSESDQKAAVSYALQLCKTNGVTNLPSSVVCSSSASSTATSPASSSSGSAASATSSSVSAASATSSVSSASDAATTTTSSGSSSTSDAATSATKNASPQNAAGVGAGILGGIAAVAALL